MANIVVEATGAAIPDASLTGYLAEPAATNNALWSRDGTNAAWTLGVTMTRAKTQVGVDGTANSATLLTGGAVLATNTLLQSITLASQANVFQPFVKRVTGTGTIEITVDGGTTWTPIQASINSSTFTQVQVTKTAANPSVGFRITTSTDAIAVDMMDCQGGSVATSPIPTTTIPVARNADVLTYVSVGNIVKTTGGVVAEITSNTSITPLVWFGSSTAQLELILSTGNKLGAYDGTNEPPLSSGFTMPFATIKKVGVTWGATTFAGSVDGSAVVTGPFDGSFDVSANFGVGINATAATTANSFLGGTIRNVQIFGTALSAAQLIAKTS